jgi:hypothetical protein
MSLVMTHSDDSALTGLTLVAERGLDSATVDVKILNNGTDDVDGACLTLYAENDPLGSPGLYFSTGHPVTDELMGRFQITGQDSTATPGQEIVLGVVQPMGHLAKAQLPTIKAGDWILANFWLHQAGASAGGGSVNIKFELALEDNALSLPWGPTQVATGIDSGRKQPRSFLINGRGQFVSGPPDEHLLIAGGHWIIEGEESGAAAGTFLDFDQTDSAAATLAAGEEYLAVVTQGSSLNMTKGLKAVAGSSVRPTPPDGELLIAWVTVSYSATTSIIDTGNVEDARIFGRFLVAAPPTGLYVVVHPGEALISNFRQIRTLPGQVALTASSTNWLWIEATGTITVTLTVAPPSAGAISLAVVTTDSANVTVNTDARSYIIPACTDGGTVTVTLADGDNDDVPVPSCAPVAVVKIVGLTSGGTLRGILSTFFAQTLHVLLATGSVALVVKHLDSGSVADDQIFTIGAGDVTLSADGNVVTLVRDTDAKVWRMVSKSF